MVQVFKRDNISAYIALLFIALVCKLKFLLHPELIIPEALSFNALFFNISRLRNVFVQSPSLYVFLTIAAQFFFALYLNSAVVGQKLHVQKNYFTALSFILITSFLPIFNYFSTAFISNVFLFISFAGVLQLSNTTQPRKWCFNIGMLLSIAVFFYFPVILFLIVFMLFIWLLRPFVIQELFAYLLGFITPFYFAAGVLYFKSDLGHAIARLNFHIQLPVQGAIPIAVYLFALICLLLLFYSLHISGTNAFKNAMLVKKKWRLIYVYLFFSLVAAIFTYKIPGAYAIIALTPFSILLSQSFHNRKEKLNIFTLYFLIVSVLLVQWIFLK